MRGAANLLLPPANEVYEGYVFTPVCQSFCSGGGWTRGVPALGGCLLQRGVSGPRGVPAGGVSGPRGCLLGGCLLWEGVPAPGGWGPPGPHPRGKLRGIRSRPTPKGQIEGDQVQAHTQGAN